MKFTRIYQSQFGDSTSWDTPISINWFQIANPTTCNRYPTSRYGLKFQPPHRSKQQICASDTWGIVFHHWRSPLSNMTKTSNSGNFSESARRPLNFSGKTWENPWLSRDFSRNAPIKWSTLIRFEAVPRGGNTPSAFRGNSGSLRPAGIV